MGRICSCSEVQASHTGLEQPQAASAGLNPDIWHQLTCNSTQVGIRGRGGVEGKSHDLLISLGSSAPTGDIRTPASYTCVHFYPHSSILMKARELPWWFSGKESACQCRRCRFDPWVGKIPWRRKWQPTPVLLSGKSHGQRSLAGYSSWGL